MSLFFCTFTRMKKALLIVSALLCLAGLVSCREAAPKPINIILDTDLGNDIDDAMAMDMLYKYMDERQVNLLAIMISKDCGIYPAKFADIMNVWYGYDVPIGVVSDGVPGDGNVVNYAQVVSEMKDDAGDALYATSDMDYASLPDAEMQFTCQALGLSRPATVADANTAALPSASVP